MTIQGTQTRTPVREYTSPPQTHSKMHIGTPGLFSESSLKHDGVFNQYIIEDSEDSLDTKRQIVFQKRS